MTTRLSDIAGRGLWRRHPSLVQLFGLCPLLAVSTSLAKGLGLGLATTAVLCASCLLASLCRHALRAEIRILAYVLIIAALVSALELAMRAYFDELHAALGIFVPLIATNCIILSRLETFASRNGPVAAVADGLAMGLGFTAVFALLGAVRELAARGTVLGDVEILLGERGAGLGLELFDDGLLVAALPPGAFIALALLVALKNVLGARRTSTTEVEPAPAAA